jgi:hypothetical protein
MEHPGQPHTLNVPALRAAARGGSVFGSFHSTGEGGDALAAAAAGRAFTPAGQRATRFSPGAKPGGASRDGASSAPTSTAQLDGDDEVELLFSATDGPVDFDARWQHSLERASANVALRSSMDASGRAATAAAAAAAGAEGASGAAADTWTAEELQRRLSPSGGDASGAAAMASEALVRKLVRSVTTSRAAAAGAGSERDLLGRLTEAQARWVAAWPPPGQQGRQAGSEQAPLPLSKCARCLIARAACQPAD